jgi:hypothetical protein
MQQRRLRLGDILDDYCPRERRITNHAVVAMIEETVKQTRCTTCDAEHEYKQARVPATRRRKTAAPAAQLVDASRPVVDQDVPEEISASDDVPVMEDDQTVGADAHAGLDDDHADGDDVHAGPGEAGSDDATAGAELQAGPDDQTGAEESGTIDESAGDNEEWPVHRPLIRATLPRPEGHTPERKAPDFTFRPSGGKFDPNRNGRHRGHSRQGRQAQGHSPSNQGSRFGGQRGPGGQGGPQGQRHGNRSGQGGGGGRPGQGQGQGRGPRPGGGRKRGR